MRRVCTAILLSALTFAGAAVRADDAAEQPDIDKLIEAVGSDDKADCLHAVDTLAGLGAEAKAAVPALIEALANEDREIAWHAARTLSALGENAEAAVPALVAALDDENVMLRAYAVYALGQIGQVDEATVDKLLAKAFDSDALVRRAAVRAIRNINPPVEKTLPIALKLLEESDPEIVVHVLQNYAEQGEAAVPRLKEILKHEKACYWACLVAADLGPVAKDLVPELTDVLGHESPDVRLQDLLALAAIGPDAKAAVPAIVKLLEGDKFEHVRYAAGYALSQIGGDDAIAALNTAVEGDDLFLKSISAWGLAHLNPEDEAAAGRAVTVLVEALQSDNSELRTHAAKGLGDFDGHEDVVAPALVKALRDDDPNVVANAVASLVQLGPESLRGIGSGLKNKALRGHALKIVQKLGPEAKAAVPALIEALGDDDDEFRQEAVLALASIGPASSKAAPQLIELTSSEVPELRRTACYALGRMGPKAKAAVPRLTELVAAEDEIDQRVAVWALLKIAPTDELKQKAVPMFIGALQSDRELVRYEAAMALGELGASDAIAPLEQLQNDPVAIVRAAAAEAIDKLKN